MASNMRTSRAGLDVIKMFEGFRPRYQKLPNGKWIVGYGHVRDTQESVEITEDEAETLLREYDLQPFERLVTDCVLAPLNQNEFDALVSLAYNIGAKAFAQSEIVAQINGGNRLAAAKAFDEWCRARIGGRVQIVDALVRRRAAEKALFLRSPGQGPSASSRIYIPVAQPKRLPPPAVREILVESETRAEPNKAVDVKPERSVQTATEDAAESVRRRLVRIIGEDGSAASNTDETTDGASPEEITAAISALAGDQDQDVIAKSVWPAREDPPPPFLDDVDPLDEGDESSPPVDRIDDLEEVRLSDDEIRRAVKLNKAIEAHENGSLALDALPYGLLSLVGGGLATYGFALQFGWLTGGETGQTELGAYLPPFLILLGAILLIVMAYYFVQALRDTDD